MAWPVLAYLAAAAAGTGAAGYIQENLQGSPYEGFGIHTPSGFPGRAIQGGAMAPTSQPTQSGVQPAMGYHTVAPQGWSQQSPGVGEQYFQQQQQRFDQGGYGAQFYNQQGQHFGAPGTGEQFWNQVQGGMNGPSASEQVWDWSYPLSGPGNTEGYAAQNYNAFGAPSQSEQFAQHALPQVLNQGPSAGQTTFQQFNPMGSGVTEWYQQARQNTGEAIQDQLAAQGLMGSSYGAEATAGAMAQLGAEEARANAQYGLDAANTAANLARTADTGQGQQFSTGANIAQGADAGLLARVMSGGQLQQMGDAQQLARYGLLGNLGAQVDANQLAQLGMYGNLAFGAQGLEEGRIGQGMGLAQGLDVFGLQQAMAGMNAAQAAQALRDGRVQGYLDNTWRGAAFDAQRTDQWNQWLLQNQMDLFNAALAAEMGQGAMGYADSQRDEDQFRNDAASLPNMISDWGALLS